MSDRIGHKPDGQREEELVVRFRAGDPRAFDELAEMHLDRVFALAVELLGSREDAEDVTQEVLIKLYRQLSRSRRPERLRPWLYRVCVNQCTDLVRTRRRQPISLESLEPADPESSLTPTPLGAAAGFGLSVRTALAKLPPQQRTAFMLRHFAGLAVPEIARALRCAPATVRVHLSRATRSLRDTLSQKEGNDGPM